MQDPNVAPGPSATPSARAALANFSAGFVHGARIKWGRSYDSIIKWDEVATWGLETFGLPGDRYVTEVTINEMIWWFREPADQILFTLRNGTVECIKLPYLV